MSEIVSRNNDEVWIVTNDGRRFHIDSNAIQAERLPDGNVLILGSDHKLWWSYKTDGLWNISPPPRRYIVDANVKSFQIIDSNTIMVRSSADNKLWKEYGPFNSDWHGTNNRSEITI